MYGFVGERGNLWIRCSLIIFDWLGLVISRRSILGALTVLLSLCATGAWLMAAITCILKTMGCPAPQEGWPPLGSDAQTNTITDSSFSWYAVRASSIAVISVVLAFIYCRIIGGEEPPKLWSQLLHSFPFFIAVLATVAADIFWFMAAANSLFRPNNPAR